MYLKIFGDFAGGFHEVRSCRVRPEEASRGVQLAVRKAGGGHWEAVPEAVSAGESGCGQRRPGRKRGEEPVARREGGRREQVGRHRGEEARVEPGRRQRSQRGRGLLFVLGNLCESEDKKSLARLYGHLIA